MIPLFFERLMPQVGDRVVGMAVVSPIYRNSSRTKEAKRFVRAFGLWAFLVEMYFYFGAKLMNLAHSVTGAGSPRSVSGMARAREIQVMRPNDVNDPAFLSELRNLRPDVIVSVACPQIFREELLELPSLGCINVHSSLLPDYRGMLPTFWVLANNESETGVSVHFMTPGIDEGDILFQHRIRIEPGETLRSLMAKCKRAAADGVVEAIRQFESGTLASVKNRVEEGRYFSFPSRTDVQRFRAFGRALR